MEPKNLILIALEHSTGKYRKPRIMMDLDMMSAGVALAWATEAPAKGVISQKETVVSLKFHDAAGYKDAVRHLGSGSNDCYRLPARGIVKAAEQYGGFCLRIQRGNGRLCHGRGLVHLPGFGIPALALGQRWG